MKLINTGDPQFKPSVVMLVYGEGGVGKTTFASTAPKPLLADCEGGSKYFGLRGIKIPVAIIENWGDMKDVLMLAKTKDYETIIIDPIGELMEKLKRMMVAKGDSKLVQKDGSPSMAGWGFLKKTMKDYIKALRDVGKHVILVAHVVEKDDEGRLVKRPMIETKIDRDIINMVDVVGFMTSVEQDGEDVRIIRVDATSDKFVAKDRSGQLGKVIPPRFDQIIEACQGTKNYKWMKEDATTDAPEEPKDEAPKNDKAKIVERLNKLKELGFKFNKKAFVMGETVIEQSEVSDSTDDEFELILQEISELKNKETTDALGLDPEDMPTDKVETANDDELNKKLAKAKGGTKDGGKDNKKSV